MECSISPATAQADSCPVPSTPCARHHSMTQCLVSAVHWVETTRMRLQEESSDTRDDASKKSAVTIRQILQAALVLYRTSRQRTSAQFFIIAFQFARDANSILQMLNIHRSPVTEASSEPRNGFSEALLKWFAQTLTGLEKKLDSVYTSEEISELFLEKMWAPDHSLSCRQRKMLRSGTPNKEEQLEFLAACFLQECVDVKLRGEDDILFDPSRELDAFLDICREQDTLEPDRNTKPESAYWCRDVVELMEVPEQSTEPRTKACLVEKTAKLPQKTQLARIPPSKKTSHSGRPRKGKPTWQASSPRSSSEIWPHSTLPLVCLPAKAENLGPEELRKIALSHGVHYYFAERRFSVSMSARQRVPQKTFSARKYGVEGALRLAVEAASKVT
ncbi:hypothetical protein TGDOM2_267642 [Toxoplasma gondii GAB2-2007-GAL-DOM2]|uniref:Uncharacterized protein n=5 Tax=Toxoplasma gondii TaxID=5811 RepID=S7VW31_TOXGG|nr:hypothetical protein TGGT1_267642 [Toxoplasma gondii GT1]KAF4644049.1 hypothetical protein TGRH88_010470 [Toxoplasma gondii]KFG38896.1 hypothetical protein TGDOM2_267642 [Toxoplasma gondii GAB2-2007-GAL-DOM2]KFG42763.1 hypothetical protein TGFOU_267642 [Toxoplasma gondii FOU]RQX74199.1 hypothetical protein TGCAST_267642 [Toxoplasma gondii CAST]